MTAAKKKTARGRKQDRARVAGRQNYEVKYESKKTGGRPPRSRRLSRKSAIAASGSRSGSDASPISLAGAGLPAPAL